MGALAGMSRTGDCWDNSVAESFFSSFKQEADLDAGKTTSVSQTR
ncbi:MAG: transposase InsO family protein [Bradymonadia bacterium]|jgi:transposase InsO family protein